MPWQGSASVPLLFSGPALGIPMVRRCGWWHRGACAASWYPPSACSLCPPTRCRELRTRQASALCLALHPSVGVWGCLRGPAGVQGAVIDSVPVSTMDIAGTVMDWAGVAPSANMTTTSLRPFMTPSAAGAVAVGAVPYRPFVSSGLSSWRAVVQAAGKAAGGDAAVHSSSPPAHMYKLVCCKGTSCPGQPRNTTWDGVRQDAFFGGVETAGAFVCSCAFGCAACVGVLVGCWEGGVRGLDCEWFHVPNVC
jgi:hypothetical protein